jgi:hypothetical protein
MPDNQEKGSDETLWQALGDWENGRVRSGAKTAIWISLLFGVAFTAVSFPVVLKIPEEIAKGNYIILVALLFPLVGISALFWFVYSLAAWRKFGVTELILNPVPGCIGGDFGGYVDVPIGWRNNLKVCLTLNCLKTTTSGSGKNRSTNTKVVWQREGLASLLLAKDAVRCAFRFAIPEDLPESEKSSSSYHHWLLQMECELPGIDFKRNFTVPVFKQEVPQFSSLKTDYAKQSNPLDKAPEGTVKITGTANGLQFYYPWCRHARMAIMLMIFGGVFAAIGYFIGQEDASIIFPVVFGGVGILMVCIGLYVIGNTLTTLVSEEGIQTIRNIYGLRFKRKVVKENIVRLERTIKSQMQGGSNYRVFYSIIAHSKDKREITIADTLEGSRLADFVEQRIRSALKLEKDDSLVDDWSL